MEYFKIFFALSVAFIVAAVLLLNNKLKRIIFKEPNGSLESKMPAELLPEKRQNGDVELKNEGDEKGTNFKGAKLAENVPITSTEAKKNQHHPSQSQNVVYKPAAGTGSTTLPNSVHHVANIAIGLPYPQANNEVRGIGGIGETSMIRSFNNLETIDISGGGSPSSDRGVPTNVVEGIGGIGSTRIENAFGEIKSLKISGP